jgi:hypothetical protein
VWFLGIGAKLERLSEEQARSFFIEIKRQDRYAPHTIQMMTAFN